MAYGNVKYTEPGSGTDVRFDDDGGGSKTQAVKLLDATAGSTSAIGVSGNPLHVQGAQLGATDETAASSDTATSGLNGRLQRIAQRLTSLIATLPSALVSGRLDVNVGAHPATALVKGSVVHDNPDADAPVKVGAKAIAHGTNPGAVAAADITDCYANRHGIPFTIGGHPNIITYGMSITTAVSNTVIGPTIGAGLKFVLTRLTVILDNASTVFPSIVIGFGTANTPAISTTPGTAQIVFAHPACPAGGGGNAGDGSGIIGIGADNEELRVTTVGNAGGNGIYIVATGYTIES